MPATMTRISTKRRPNELNPATGKVMGDDEQKSIRELLDQIGWRACREYEPFDSVVRSLKANLKQARNTHGDEVAGAIELAFMTGGRMAGRAVAAKWVKVSRASALAYAFTGQDDDVSPDGITLRSKRPDRRPLELRRTQRP